MKYSIKPVLIAAIATGIAACTSAPASAVVTEVVTSTVTNPPKLGMTLEEARAAGLSGLAEVRNRADHLAGGCQDVGGNRCRFVRRGDEEGLPERLAVPQRFHRGAEQRQQVRVPDQRLR